MIPPFKGFFAKFIIKITLSNQYYYLILIIILTALFTFKIYLNIIQSYVFNFPLIITNELSYSKGYIISLLSVFILLGSKKMLSLINLKLVLN